MSLEEYSVPKFIINPLATKESIWFPERFQILTNNQENTNYLNSLWLGIVFNFFILLPKSLVKRLLLPVLNFNFIGVLIFFLTVPAETMKLAISGLRGRLRAFGISKDVAWDSVLLTHPQALIALQNGHSNLVIEYRRVDKKGLPTWTDSSLPQRLFVQNTLDAPFEKTFYNF